MDAVNFAPPITSVTAETELDSDLIGLFPSEIPDSVVALSTQSTNTSSDSISVEANFTSLQSIASTKHTTLPTKSPPSMANDDAYIMQLSEIMLEILHQAPKDMVTKDLKAHLYDQIKKLERSESIGFNLFKDEVSRIRMEMLEDRVRLRTIEKGLRESYINDVKCKANELLDHRTKEVYNENIQIVRDKVLLAKEAELARGKENALAEENTTLRRSLELTRSIELDLRTKCTQYRREIDKLRQQVKSVEDSIEKVSHDYELRLAQEEARSRKQIQSLTKERDDARCDALRLNSEFEKLRKASTQILRQRSDLEKFFYEALQEVRMQIICERRRQVLPARMKNLPISRATPHELVKFSPYTRSSPPGIENQRALQVIDYPDMHCGPPSLLLQASNEGASEPYDAINNRLVKRSNQEGWMLSTPTENQKLFKELPPIANGIPAITLSAFDDTISTGNLNNLVQVKPFEMCPLKQRTQSDIRGLQFGQKNSPLLKNNPTMNPNNNALDNTSGRLTWKRIQQLNISELSWPDKERVLMVLFKRIRDQEQQSTRKLAIQSRERIHHSVDVASEITHPMPSDQTAPKSTLFLTET